jgi:hypothetical protein
MKYPKILALPLYFLCGQEYKAIAENSGSSGKEEKPVNIIIMVSDDQRSDAIGIAGNSAIK